MAKRVAVLNNQNVVTNIILCHDEFTAEGHVDVVGLVHIGATYDGQNFTNPPALDAQPDEEEPIE